MITTVQRYRREDIPSIRAIFVDAAAFAHTEVARMLGAR